MYDIETISWADGIRAAVSQNVICSEYSLSVGEPELFFYWKKKAPIDNVSGGLFFRVILLFTHIPGYKNIYQ